MSGTYNLADFGASMEIARNGPMVVSDTQTSPLLSEPERAAYAAAAVRAQIFVVLTKGDKLVAALAVNQPTPRDWTPFEVSLLQETAERTWAAVERARAEAAVDADLRDTQLLRNLSARLVTEGNIQVLYDEIMATAIALARADAGTVQILDEAAQELVLLATQGFERTITEDFYRVNAS